MLCILVAVVLLLLLVLYGKYSEKFENKKKCLLIFYGLPRTVEQTSENIYDNIINPNKDKYEFTIIINTYSDDYNLEKLNEKLNKIYNCKNIIIENYDKNNGDDPVNARLYSPLQQEVNTHYDMYIYSRMDIILNKNVYLDDYVDSLCIVEGPNTRDSYFHNRDWDYMWIGSEKPFKIWCYYLLEHLGKKIDDNSFNYKNDIFSNLNYNQMIKIKNKIKLIDDSNTISFLHNIVNEILLNGYNVELSTTKDKEIYATIIR